jgi:hypothetical protein
MVTRPSDGGFAVTVGLQQVRRIKLHVRSQAHHQDGFGIEARDFFGRALPYIGDCEKADFVFA